MVVVSSVLRRQWCCSAAGIRLCAYHKILPLVQRTGTIQSLSQTRVEEVMARVEATGKSEVGYMQGPAFVVSSIKNLICRRKNTYHCHYIDEGRIAEAKALAKEHGAPFVSTNDILTSSFGNLANARTLFMAMNYRDRVEGSYKTLLVRLLLV